MAVIALTSAAGAPGVTTTTIALALGWPRECLLIEADVAGHSAILAGYLRGSVPHDRGLVDLGIAHRRGALDVGLRQASMPLGLAAHARLVPGLTSAAQVRTVEPIWEPLAAVLAGLERDDTDVLVDAGRLGTVGGPTPLVRAADLVLVCVGTGLPQVSALMGRVEALREELDGRGLGAGSLGLIVVGEDRPYGAREISEMAGVPIVARVAWDPATAAIFSDGRSPRRRRFSGRRAVDRTPLGGSVRAAVAAVRERAADRRRHLGPAFEKNRIEPDRLRRSLWTGEAAGA